MNGIRVIRVWTYIAENSGFLKRTLDYFSFCIAAIIASFAIKTDIIIATSPHFFTALSGMIISKIKRKKWILEIRDLWPESIVTLGAIKNKKIIRFLEKLEMTCYRSCDKIISVTNSFKKIIVSKGINREKIDIITNGVDLNLFYPKQKNKNLIDFLGLNNKFVVGYIGTIGMAHALDFIVNAASFIDDKEIHIIIMGEGAEKANIKKLKSEKIINNVSILDSVSKEKIIDYISCIDVALINLKRSDLFNTVIPSKIFENAAMQKPILLGVDGESREIIEKYSAGLYFTPEYTEDFIDKLMSIKNDPRLLEDLKEGSRKLASDYNRENLALKMLSSINRTKSN